MNRQSRRVLLSASIAAAAALACGALMAGEETIKLTDAKARNVVIGGCVTCHSLDYITMNGPIMDKAKWEKTVTKMIDVYKAPISKENAAVIVEYLATHYSAGK